MSVDCIEAVKTIKEIPVLLIHSKHDHIIPYTETLKIYEHCKDISKIKLWITENKGHTYTHIELKEEYLHKITEFLEENNL